MACNDTLALITQYRCACGADIIRSRHKKATLFLADSFFFLMVRKRGEKGGDCPMMVRLPGRTEHLLCRLLSRSEKNWQLGKYTFPAAVICTRLRQIFQWPLKKGGKGGETGEPQRRQLVPAGQNTSFTAFFGSRWRGKKLSGSGQLTWISSRKCIRSAFI